MTVSHQRQQYEVMNDEEQKKQNGRKKGREKNATKNGEDV
jgi:hypothetical protein